MEDPFSSDSVVLRNLKSAMFLKKTQYFEERVMSVATLGNMIAVGTHRLGCRVYSVHGDSIKQVCTLGEQPSAIARSRGRHSPPGGSTFYDLHVTKDYLVYLKEVDCKHYICIHKTKDVMNGETDPHLTLAIHQRAPMVVDFDLNFLVIGGGAWTSSWTGAGNVNGGDETGTGANCVKVMKLDSLDMVRSWKVCENSVYRLRQQTTPSHNMLGVADSRLGIKVFDLSSSTNDSYAKLYEVPVEEIRDFELVADVVAVFHKFEPNVSFWNMKEQRTILCINIQDQIQKLVEEFYEENEEESSFFDDSEDHVTAVLRLPTANDSLLVYGTKSGCIFGLLVSTRSKVFSLPFPYELPDDHRIRRDVSALTYMPVGKLVVCYEGHGLTILDFSPENPPHRPPTRCQRLMEGAF